MDNAFAAADDVPALQAICDSLGEQQIRALLDKWLRILPHPFTEDDIAAGYRYDVSIVQAEFSLAADAGPPGDRADLPGADDPRQPRHRAPGQGQPDLRPPDTQRPQAAHPQRVPYPDHDGRTSPRPSASSTRKPRSSSITREGERCAPRPSSTIPAPVDFGIGKGLANLPALRQVGFTANRRLLSVQKISHDPAAGAAAITAITRPITTPPRDPRPRPALHRRTRPGPALGPVRLQAAAQRIHQPRTPRPPRAAPRQAL